MEYRFEDILEIRNGKNQKAVENPEGRYPIYGSGGVIGYADDYICEADTIIIGRKGSINNPIYASEPFWNVDTAFGLSVGFIISFTQFIYRSRCFPRGYWPKANFFISFRIHFPDNII